MQKNVCMVGIVYGAPRVRKVGQAAVPAHCQTPVLECDFVSYLALDSSGRIMWQYLEIVVGFVVVVVVVLFFFFVLFFFVHLVLISLRIVWIYVMSRVLPFGKNFNVGRHTQTFQPNVFIPSIVIALLISSILHHFQ